MSREGSLTRTSPAAAAATARDGGGGAGAGAGGGGGGSRSARRPWTPKALPSSRARSLFCQSSLKVV